MNTRRIWVVALGVALMSSTIAPAHAAGKGGKANTGGADTTPPKITVPASMRLEATAATGAVVNYSVSGNDNVDRRVSVSCSPASGSMFPLGTRSVTCQARDAAGNLATASFAVAVVDTTIPTLGLPGSVSAAAPTSTGTTVAFEVAVADRVDTQPTLRCTPTSGSVFPVGTSIVGCTATDASGNRNAGSFDVTVAFSVSAEPPPPPPAPTGAAILSWSVPSTRANGSPISVAELAGYEIYVVREAAGTTEVIPVADPLRTNYTVEGLATDVYHFAVGAVDTAGLVSELSSIVSKEIR